MKPEIHLKTIFSNTQHFAVYVSCMPSRRLRRLDTPLIQSDEMAGIVCAIFGGVSAAILYMQSLEIK